MCIKAYFVIRCFDLVWIYNVSLFLFYLELLHGKSSQVYELRQASFWYISHAWIVIVFVFCGPNVFQWTNFIMSVTWTKLKIDLQNMSWWNSFECINHHKMLYIYFCVATPKRQATRLHIFFCFEWVAKTQYT